MLAVDFPDDADRPDFDTGGGYLLWQWAGRHPRPVAPADDDDDDGDDGGENDDNGKNAEVKKGSSDASGDPSAAADDPGSVWANYGRFAETGLFCTLERAADSLAMLGGTVARLDAAGAILAAGGTAEACMDALIGDSAPPADDTGAQPQQPADGNAEGLNRARRQAGGTIEEPSLGLGASRDIVPEMLLAAIPGGGGGGGGGDAAPDADTAPDADAAPDAALAPGDSTPGSYPSREKLAAALPLLREQFCALTEWIGFLYEFTCAMACGAALSADPVPDAFSREGVVSLARAHYGGARRAWASITARGLGEPLPLPAPLANPAAHLVSLTPYTPRRLPLLSLDEAAVTIDAVLAGGGYAVASELGERNLEIWAMPPAEFAAAAAADCAAAAPVYSEIVTCSPGSLRAMFRRVAAIPPQRAPAGAEDQCDAAPPPHARALMARFADRHFNDPSWAAMALAGEVALVLAAENDGSYKWVGTSESPTPLPAWATTVLGMVDRAQEDGSDGGSDGGSLDAIAARNEERLALWEALPGPVLDHFHHYAHLHHLTAQALLANPARTRRKTVKMMPLYGVSQEGSPAPPATLLTLGPLLIRALTSIITLELLGPRDGDCEEGLIWWLGCYFAGYTADVMKVTHSEQSPELLYMTAQHHVFMGLGMIHALLRREGYIVDRVTPYGSKELRFSVGGIFFYFITDF
jgi:hypothetical protein